MERREPTLSSANINDTADSSSRRSSTSSAQDAARRPTPTAPRQATAEAKNSALPAIALVVALIAVGGSSFLGWQLFQAQVQLKEADSRIHDLEQQLSLTSEESSASVVTLQANLKKSDGDLRTLITAVEGNRKAIASLQEKVAAVGRDSAAGKKTANDAVVGLKALKAEVTTNKELADGISSKADAATAAVTAQQLQVQDLKESLSKLELELVELDNLTRRTRANEEAISAIDDYRRTTNREILQIKQQMGLAPKQ